MNKVIENANRYGSEGTNSANSSVPTRSQMMLPPDPPRHPRLRFSLQSRWLIGLFGGLCLATLLAINVVYLTCGADVTSFADEALDHSATSIRGEVVSIGPTFLHTEGNPWLQVRYSYSDLTGELREGRSLLRHTLLKPGGKCWVEYLQTAPETSRLLGTTRQIQAPLLDAVVRWLLLPGTLLFLIWLQGVMRLRLLLSMGPATHAEVIRQRRYGWINPPQLRIDYRFVDHLGKEHSGWHWIAQHSQLGRKIHEEGLSTPAVIYDETRPSRSRLIGANCFVT